MKRLGWGALALAVAAVGIGWWATSGLSDPALDARMDADQQRELAQEIGYLK